jgi:pimeloyl-ACP methyl ester carboxylesterase
MPKKCASSKYLSPYVVRTVGTRPARLAVVHRHARRRQYAQGSQRQPMAPSCNITTRIIPSWAVISTWPCARPTTPWNGFYDDYVYPLVDNLVREFFLFGDVDPNKVFIMGYSHGGYGAFAIGPKEPDLFAAIHASAGAPTDGETTGKTLRNTVFTCMVGENDTMYGRFERDQKFRDTIRQLRGRPK